MNANLLDRLNEMASREEPKIGTTVWYMNGNQALVESSGYQLIKDALRPQTASDEEIFNLTEELVELWYHGNIDEAYNVFGQVHRENIDNPLIATLTGFHNELRFWVGKAGCVGKTHCDSAGACVPFNIVNRNGLEKRYIDMASRIISTPYILPNGGMVFAKGDELNLPSHYSYNQWPPEGHEIDYSEKLRK